MRAKWVESYPLNPTRALRLDYQKSHPEVLFHAESRTNARNIHSRDDVLTKC